MNQNRWIFFLVSLGCVPKVLPGPVPVEEADSIRSGYPRHRESEYHLEALIRTGSAMDPLGQEGLRPIPLLGW